MTWRWRYLKFLQHNIAGLISGITFIVLLQSGEASTVEENKHTHTCILKGKCLFGPLEKNLFIWLFGFYSIFDEVCINRNIKPHEKAQSAHLGKEKFWRDAQIKRTTAKLKRNCYIRECFCVSIMDQFGVKLHISGDIISN